MLHLLHTSQLENTKNNKLRKTFSMVEIIIGLAIGSVLIFMTYNVLSQSLKTTNDTIVMGTMDNYAHSIQKRIRKNLITARYIDVASMQQTTNIITDPTSTDVRYSNLYFANEDELRFSFEFDTTSRVWNYVYYPQGITIDGGDTRIMEVLFDENNSNGVEISNIKWSLDNYHVTAAEYNQPDYSKRPTRLVSYQFTLSKTNTYGERLEKTYHFKEVLDCAI